MVSFKSVCDASISIKENIKYCQFYIFYSKIKHDISKNKCGHNILRGF